MTAWTMEVGTRPYRVVAEERLDRGGKVYLRWWEDRNWKRHATGITVRNHSGAVVAARVEKVEKQLKAIHGRLTNNQSVEEQAVDVVLTLTSGLQLAIDPHKGLYPRDTPHRREVQRAVQDAVKLVGDVTWASIRPSDVVGLYRRRAEQLHAKKKIGRRGAEVTVTRLLALAEWLRGEGRIPIGCCRAPKGWKAKLAEEMNAPEPSRPRHTVEELRKILAVAADVDPRLALVLELGAELRLGQVMRARRVDLDLTTDLLRVRGSGKKSGTLMKLIPSQRRAIDTALAGYLAPLEAEGGDYPLFPAGQLRGGRLNPRTAKCSATQRHAKPMDRTSVRGWFHEAERLATIEPVPGRAWYGLRRAGVDGAQEANASPAALQKLGGWSDSQIPDRIYADQDALVAVHAAAVIRAKIRGPDTVVAYPRDNDAGTE